MKKLSVILLLAMSGCMTGRELIEITPVRLTLTSITIAQRTEHDKAHLLWESNLAYRTGPTYWQEIMATDTMFYHLGETRFFLRRR